MKLYILIDEKGIIISSTRARILKEQIEVEMNDESETLNYKYIDGELVELTPEEKEEYFGKVEIIDKSEEIKSVLNSMIMAVIPEGESLTKENAPTLVDIIKPENQGDKPTEGKLGDINNPIEVVGNVSTDGFLYTYGLYYSYGGKKYKCERGSAPDTQGSIKLYYTPDQLIGHYFVTV